MKPFLQLDLFRDEQAAVAGGPLVKTIHTDLGQFGNRTDILIVEDGTVRGVSLLECNNPAVSYHPRQASTPVESIKS